jgi:hypothetical protein
MDRRAQRELKARRGTIDDDEDDVEIVRVGRVDHVCECYEAEVREKKKGAIKGTNGPKRGQSKK